ncbi:MAG TPA: DEAD/DEAH box helicase, partial [Limnochordales bacterium]
LAEPFPAGEGAPEGVWLVSLEKARSSPWDRWLQAVDWDLVVVDEAHRLKNRDGAGFRLVSGLRKAFLLLLTATPVHNHLLELHALVSLLRPGQLGTPRAFRRQCLLDSRTLRDAQAVRRSLAQVLIRTTREQAGLVLAGRRVVVREVPFAAEEEQLYAAIEEWLAQASAELGPGTPLLLATLLREAASSPQACAASLARLAAGKGSALPEGLRRELERLACRAEEVSRRRVGPKVRWLVHRARRLGPGGGQLVAFTQFSATARAACRALRRAGVVCGMVCGSTPEARRRRVLERFGSRLAVLVCTDVASEGHNLQFCSRLVNLDLPWNPMRIEQRIGRLHRLGQTRTVQVVHLMVPGTIEEDVLWLVYEKLGMFREAVGEADEVVASVPGGLPAAIARAVLQGTSPRRRRQLLGELGKRVERRWRRLSRALEQSRRTLDGPSGGPEADPICGSPGSPTEAPGLASCAGPAAG